MLGSTGVLRAVGTILMVAGGLVVLINTAWAGFIAIVLVVGGVGLRVEAAIVDLPRRT